MEQCQDADGGSRPAVFRLLLRRRSSEPSAANEAFNLVNGDVFRWKWMWERIAGWFGIARAPYDGTIRPLKVQMSNNASVWRRIAERDGLVEPDLGRPIDVVNDMSKSRRLGFADYQPTDDAFFRLFAQLRAGRLIPDHRCATGASVERLAHRLKASTAHQCAIRGRMRRAISVIAPQPSVYQTTM